MVNIIEPENCKQCQAAQKEIEFLRNYISEIEKKNEDNKKKLQEIVNTQLNDLSRLTQKINCLEEINCKFQNNLALFAVDNNPNVSKYWRLKY